MKNFVQEGKTIDHIALADISSGDVVLVGPMICVAVADIASGETGPVATEGVFNLPKIATTAFAVGAAPRWDVSTGQFSTAAAAAGDVSGAAVVTAAALAADTTLEVKLTPNGSATIT